MRLGETGETTNLNDPLKEAKAREVDSGRKNVNLGEFDVTRSVSARKGTRRAETKRASPRATANQASLVLILMTNHQSRSIVLNLKSETKNRTNPPSSLKMIPMRTGIPGAVCERIAMLPGSYAILKR